MGVRRSSFAADVSLTTTAAKGKTGVEIIDNISKRLFDELRASLKAGDRLNIAASCFSIYAYEALRKELVCFARVNAILNFV